jgi:hypothetical protein
MTKSTGSAGAPRRSWFWLQGAIVGGAAVTVPGTALITAILLFPAIAFYVTETTKGRPVGRVMLLMGSTALFMPLRYQWSHGGSLASAMDILSDPGRALLAWTACGAGWLVCELVQVCAKYLLAMQARRETEGLQREKTSLSDEWTFD